MSRERPQSEAQRKPVEAVQRKHVLASADALLAAIDELLATPTPEPIPTPVHR